MLKKFIVTLLLATLIVPALSVFAQETGTLADVLTKDGRFKNLLAAVNAAGLTDTLTGKDALTVLAPTDDAFAKLSPDVVNYILGNKELLAKLVTSHVIAGALDADALAKAGTLKSASGEELTVQADQSKVLVNGMLVDVKGLTASNGVAYVINAVLIPTITLPEVDPLAVSDNVINAGSSTVYPVAERMADLFNKDGFSGTITVDSIGTGAGFERFCKTAETDIANASRAIKSDEVENCKANNRNPIGLYFAIDALTIAVSTQNDFVDNLTSEQLAKIFSGQVKTWADVNAAWPAEPIKLFSPGTDSGTFDYFVEHVFAKDKAKILNAPGIQLSEDDNVLVQGIAGDKNAIGYFGYAYFAENQDKLRAVSIDGIAPSATTAENGSYPLARPLFIYVDAGIMAAKPQVAAFVNYFLSNVEAQLGTGEGQIGYFPVSTNALNLAKLQFLAATSSAPIPEATAAK